MIRTVVRRVWKVAISSRSVGQLYISIAALASSTFQQRDLA
jgi:hypothetical protein